jgi:1-phosphofructokinase family hexose kinase
VIRVVGANPTMDRIAMWPPITLGAVNRATDVLALAAGKGLNVARGIRQLGAPVAMYGFVGGHVGAYVRDGCRTAGIEDRLTAIGGETRVCTIAIEREAGRVTVLNEPGPVVTEDEADRLIAALAADCRPGDLLVLAGTLPLGLQPEVGARMVRLGRDAGCQVILDSSGPVLRAGAAERPWMIKCNAGEFAALEADADPSGVAPVPDDPLALLPAVRARIHGGIPIVVITLGPAGLIASTAERASLVHAPPVPVVNPIASGDLLLAVLVARLADGQPLDAALVDATACAAGSVSRLKPEIPPPDEVARLRAAVWVEALPA